MHKDFILSLGGTRAVYDWLIARGCPVKYHSVKKWRYVGVSWRYRPLLVRMAAERLVPVPSGFLDPTAGHADADQA